MALIIGIMIASILDKMNVEYLHYICLTDNRCAESLAIVKKANLKCEKLAELTYFLSFLIHSSKSNFSFARISTKNNFCADFASRYYSHKFQAALLGISSTYFNLSQALQKLKNSIENNNTTYMRRRAKVLDQYLKLLWQYEY